jgi:molecular chaperone Hsp33
MSSKISNKISKFLDSASEIRVAVVNATEAVSEMQNIQKTYPIATMMVGRSMVAASLMASQLKDGEMVSLYFRGDGPIELVFAEANFEGGVRGYTTQPQLNLPLVKDQLNLKGAMGDGFLTVVRTHRDRPQPYRGTVAIQTAEIGDDVAFYLQQSQQVRSAVTLGVKIDSYGRVVSAGGIIIELLPGADQRTEAKVEERVVKAGSLSEALASGATTQQILDTYLPGFNLTEMPHPHGVSYTCRCSLDRLVRSLELLTVADLDDIIQKKEPIRAKCEFCGREYVLPPEKAQGIRDRKFRKTLH